MSSMRTELRTSTADFCAYAAWRTLCLSKWRAEAIVFFSLWVVLHAFCTVHLFLWVYNTKYAQFASCCSEYGPANMDDWWLWSRQQSAEWPGCGRLRTTIWSSVTVNIYWSEVFYATMTLMWSTFRSPPCQCKNHLLTAVKISGVTQSLKRFTGLSVCLEVCISAAQNLERCARRSVLVSKLWNKCASIAFLSYTLSTVESRDNVAQRAKTLHCVRYLL